MASKYPASKSKDCTVDGSVVPPTTKSPSMGPENRGVPIRTRDVGFEPSGEIKQPPPNLTPLSLYWSDMVEPT